MGKAKILDTASPYVINLADYAKGDGSDETEAIQRAIDALPPTTYKEDVTASHPGGILYIPRPPVCYGISKTIRVVERWNCVIRCETPVSGTRNLPVNHYFRWLGPDNGTMFEFRSCHSLRVENLSMTGMDDVDIARMVSQYKLPPIGKTSRGVTGIRIGPENKARGFFKFTSFSHLNIANVATGIKLGDFADNGPDILGLSFRDVTVTQFSDCGIVAKSGNLCDITFENLWLRGVKGARHGILVESGELMVINMSDGGEDVRGAAIQVNGGGIQVIKAWSEWEGPFLATSSQAPEWTDSTHGSVNYPTILQGVRHYAGSWMVAKVRQQLENPIPLSVIYDRPVPLHLIACSLWGGVSLGAKSMASIVDQGTVFIDKTSLGFTGEGITRYGRIIHYGTRHPQNARILEPYVVDRRNTPGTAPPSSGVWAKGDAILNIDPDPGTPAKAWRGWICIEAGEPGRWAPFGAVAPVEIPQ
jgi:hypothetical protein